MNKLTSGNRYYIMVILISIKEILVGRNRILKITVQDLLKDTWKFPVMKVIQFRILAKFLPDPYEEVTSLMRVFKGLVLKIYSPHLIVSSCR